jgi:hypothetical protein
MLRGAPRGWVGKCREGKVWCSPSFRCSVSVCRYDKLWAIEREMERDGQYVHEVLCLAFGPTPIFHHRYKWAVINYELFAGILRDLAATAAAMPAEDVAHRETLADAAKALHRALAARPGHAAKNA